MGPRFAAVVPAAGTGSRMGRFKPLLDLAGRSVLARTVACLRRAGVEDVVVVAGFRAGEVRAEALAAGARVAENPDPEADMFASVRAGLAALRPSAAAAFVLPGDMPLIRPQTLRGLMAAFEPGPGRVLHPVMDGRRGHPPLLDASLVARLLAWTGQGGLRAALAELADHRELETFDPGVLLDLDRPEDLDKALRLATGA